jgi:myosin-5
MAENIYSKGTRVWFPDKDQGWISAEVTSATRGANDTFKLAFVDERGKVRGDSFSNFAAEDLTPFPQEIIIDTTAKDIKDGKGGLPPLRNPPLLETADDLATLSHLNEPSGQELSALSVIWVAYPTAQCCIQFGIAMPSIAFTHTVELY